MIIEYLKKITDQNLNKFIIKEEIRVSNKHV